MKHTLSVIVENKFGVLARVAGLFSARGYNIDSLTVSETQDTSVSRMTIVVNAEDERILEQIKKQLNKLIDVVTVTDFTKKEYIERELVFVKITFEKRDAAKLRKVLAKTDGIVLEKTKSGVIAELVGDQERIRSFIDALKGFQVTELVRSGRTAIEK
jgi:acetolactate synthase-1/3 small subunit